MALWLVFLGCGFGVIGGIVTGCLYFYAHARYLNRERVSGRAVVLTLLAARPKTTPVTSTTIPEPEHPVIPPPVGPDPAPVAVARTPAASPLEAILAFQDRSQEPVLRLLAECDRNRKTAREHFGDSLASLRTEAWDSNHTLRSALPTDVRTDLESVYADIRLLNNLVWLCTEFNRGGPGIRQQYVELSTRIADRLDELVRSAMPSVAERKRPIGLSTDAPRQAVAAGQGV